MDFSKRPLIVVDVETTGLDPKKHDIIEIGAIKVDQQTLIEIERFEVKIPILRNENVTERAMEINGYDAKVWQAEAINPIDAVYAFLDFAVDGVLISQNITFDYGFLKEFYSRFRLLDTMDYHRFDIPTISWFLQPDLKSVSLNAVLGNLGLDPEPLPHRAINGAELALKVLRKYYAMMPQRRGFNGNI